jgi:heme exporter protein CcmD
MFENLAFSSVTEFLQMGKYTFHVWSVYGLFAVFLAVNLYLPRAAHRQFIREQKRRALRAAQSCQPVEADEGRSDANGGE